MGSGVLHGIPCRRARHLRSMLVHLPVCAEEREGTAGWAAVVGAVEAHEGVRWKCILFDWPD